MSLFPPEIVYYFSSDDQEVLDENDSEFEFGKSTKAKKRKNKKQPQNGTGGGVGDENGLESPKSKRQKSSNGKKKSKSSENDSGLSGWKSIEQATVSERDLHWRLALVFGSQYVISFFCLCFVVQFIKQQKKKRHFYFSLEMLLMLKVYC
jgi:hypothetical protein